MVINKNTWHYKLWVWVNEEFTSSSIAYSSSAPSVCKYWSTICIAIPLFGILFVLLSPLVPISWCIDKLENWFKGKTLCPFGRVEFR